MHLHYYKKFSAKFFEKNNVKKSLHFRDKQNLFFVYDKDIHIKFTNWISKIDGSAYRAQAISD